jgi:hypothetical protein
MFFAPQGGKQAYGPGGKQLPKPMNVISDGQQSVCNILYILCAVYPGRRAEASQILAILQT